MFTGIIEASGTVRSLTFVNPALARLELTGPSWLRDLPHGSSVAVDGVCLTVVAAAPGHAGVSSHPEPTAAFEIMAETLSLTTLGALRAGDGVNLERALPAHGRLDGHVVQGHIDGTGRLLRRRDAVGDTRLRFSVPEELAGLVARKGSIALAGVSLTIAEVSGAAEPQCWAEVALIPTTLQATTLGSLREGDKANLEVDVLARYAARREEVAAA